MPLKRIFDTISQPRIRKQVFKFESSPTAISFLIVLVIMRVH